MLLGRLTTSCSVLESWPRWVASPGSPDRRVSPTLGHQTVLGGGGRASALQLQHPEGDSRALTLLLPPSFGPGDDGAFSLPPVTRHLHTFADPLNSCAVFSAPPNKEQRLSALSPAAGPRAACGFDQDEVKETGRTSRAWQCLSSCGRAAGPRDAGEGGAAVSEARPQAGQAADPGAESSF